MSTLTITSATQATTAAGYLENVGRAARALLAAIVAVPHASKAADVTPAAAEVRSAARREASLYRLYTLAGQYDSVMPNLAQELRIIAGRDN